MAFGVFRAGHTQGEGDTEIQSWRDQQRAYRAQLRAARREVRGVVRAVRERHVARAPLLVEGVVPLRVEAQREDARVVREDRGGAVALVDVEIDHRRAKRAAAFRQHKTRKFELMAASAGVAQVTALRRSWLEKRPLGLANGRFIAIVTGGPFFVNPTSLSAN